MALPLRYSVQASALKPEGFTGEYGRMMVDYRPIIDNITITASDYDLIAQSIAEGRAIRLVDDTGRALGEFIAGLAGGFDISTFTQATLSDLRISFKPTQVLLASAREVTEFQRQPTVARDPQIEGVIFTYDIAGVSTVVNDTISTNDSGLLRINGTNYVKGSMSIAVRQRIALTVIVTVVALPTPIYMGEKYMDIILTNSILSALILTSALAPGDWTIIKVSLTGTNRSDERSITLIDS